VGEYVAACVAGVFSLEDSLRLIVEPFGLVAEDIGYSQPRLSFVPSVTDAPSGDEAARAQYWSAHLLQPVRFESGMQTLHEQGCELFVEIGPDPTLMGVARRCLPEGAGIWLPSLREGRSNWGQMLETLGELYVRGADVDWSGFDGDYARRRVALPTYPFQRERYWLDTAATAPRAAASVVPHGRSVLHPLLDRKVEAPTLDTTLFETELSVGRFPFLADHRVFDEIVLSGACYVSLFLGAGEATYGGIPCVLENLVFSQCLVLAEDTTCRLQLPLTRTEDGRASINLISFRTDGTETSDAWSDHARCELRVGHEAGPAPAPVSLDELRGRCDREIDLEVFHSNVRQREIELGPSFAWIRSIRRGQNEVLAEMAVPEGIEGPADHLLHPGLIDSCFQLLSALAPAESRETLVPFSLDRFRLYVRPGREALWGHGRLRPAAGSKQRELAGDVRVVDETGRVVAELEGLQVRRASRTDFVSGESVEEWLYEVEWRPQVRRGRAVPATYMPRPAEIRERASRASPAWLDGPELVSYEELLGDLETLCPLYVVKACQELGWDFRVGRRFAAAEIAEELRVIPRHQRLLNRLLEILAEEGVLRPWAGRWQVARPPCVAEPTEPWEALCARYPEAEAELSLLGRCGSRLAEILRGERDPLSLIFPQGDLAAATKLYQDSPIARFANLLVQQAVSMALADAPAGRGVRILEIGAGTGGTTSHVLPHLVGRQTEYLFTDLSPMFTTKARERFGEYPFVRYELLVIERAPEAQGVDRHQFDVVIAANVLHATRDLRETARHVQELLVPGGMLILVEGTSRQRWLDLVFGLTEGWWKFSDHDLRPSYPLLTARDWEVVLHESGFEEVEVLGVEGNGEGVRSLQSVMVARTDQARPEEVAEAENWVILADQQGVGEQLAALAEQRGHVCSVVRPGEAYERIGTDEYQIDPASPEDYERVIEATLGERKGGLTRHGRNRGADGLRRPSEREGVPLPRSPRDAEMSPRKTLSRVVHLWSLDCAMDAGGSGGDLVFASERGCRTALHLIQALVGKRLSVVPSLALVTRGAQPVGSGVDASGVRQSPLWGMGKVIALEHPELNCVRLDLDRDVQQEEARVLFEELWSGTEEDQVAFRGGERYVARLMRHSEADGGGLGYELEIPASQPYRLQVTAKGTLEHLRLQPVCRPKPGAGEVEIRVRATGLNLRDVLWVLDLLPGQSDHLGSECSGEVVAVGEEVDRFEVGDAVVGIAADCFSQYTIAKVDMVVQRPERLSFEEAATIPVAFLTARCALDRLAKMGSGDRVLIHGAAGGVGSAAAQLAQQVGAEVFATASPAKWEFLRALGIKHVMSSRTLEFAREIEALTEGQGVDIVLNSLAGEFIPKSLSVLSATGRFVEIGKTGVWAPNRVAELKPNASYFVFDLVELCSREPALIQSMLAELMRELQEGELSPLPRRVFPIQEAAHAFRTMQRAEHIGKIVVSQPAGTTDSRKSIPLRRDGTYLVTGGLGGLGQVVSRWLVGQGARHLVLVGRRKPSDAARSQLAELEEAGARVVVMQADVSDEEQVAGVLGEIRASLPPLRGLIHAAGVLDDGVLMQQNWPRFNRVMESKADGAWNLHVLTRDLPLDFFVLFSSAASVLGSPGQSNHAAANASLDALAWYRAAQGLPALSINWGPWSEVGAAAKGLADEEARQRPRRLEGVGTIAPDRGLKVLERLLSSSSVDVVVAPINWARLPGELTASPFFADCVEPLADRGEQTGLLRRLKETPMDDRRSLLMAHIGNQVATVLGLSRSAPVDVTKGFFELGMDSLTSVELKNLLQSSLGLGSLPATLAFDHPTVEELTEYLTQDALSSEFSSTGGDMLPEATEPSGASPGVGEDLTVHETMALLELKVQELRERN